MTLEEEAKRLDELLAGKHVSSFVRHRVGELLINFSDGSRLYVDASGNEIECSVETPDDD